MLVGAPARYLIARLRGGDVAAVSSPPEGAPPQAAWSTYIWVEHADEAAAKAVALLGEDGRIGLCDLGGGLRGGPVDGLQRPLEHALLVGQELAVDRAFLVLIEAELKRVAQSLEAKR